MNDIYTTKLIEEIKNNYKNIYGIIIFQDNKKILEEYFNGKTKNDRFNIASVTKSILSASFGIALDKGYINSVNDKVIDYFPNLKLNTNRVRDNVTIHELLSMTAPYSFRGFGQKIGKLIHSENWIEYSLNILGLGGNSKEFKYSDSSAHLLSGIISNTTNMTTREFTNKFICSKIGMTEIPDLEMKSFNVNDILFTKEKSWLKDKQGITIGGWGLTLTLNDMANFGLLYLNNGIYSNEIIISENWIKKTLKDYSTNYGYLWWLKNTKLYKSYYALGTGGNIIACIPDYNLVIAISSEVTRDNINNRWQLIDEFIIPYLKT